MVFTAFHTRNLRFLELINLANATDLVAELAFHPTLPPSSSLSFSPFLPSIYPLVECPSYTGIGDNAVSKTEVVSALMEPTFYWGGLGEHRY